MTEPNTTVVYPGFLEATSARIVTLEQLIDRLASRLYDAERQLEALTQRDTKPNNLAELERALCAGAGCGELRAPGSKHCRVCQASYRDHLAEIAAQAAAAATPITPETAPMPESDRPVPPRDDHAPHGDPPSCSQTRTVASAPSWDDPFAEPLHQFAVGDRVVVLGDVGGVWLGTYAGGDASHATVALDRAGEWRGLYADVVHAGEGW